MYKTLKLSADQCLVSNRYCLFGLPVDPLTVEATKTLIRQQAPLKRQLVLSTININWVVRALSDPAFRDAVRQSDIVTIDGKPLQCLARLFGYPIKETVPGSSLIEELLNEKGKESLTIFLFGGDGNAAQTAMEKINRQPGGLQAVGATNPGYGTVAEMSNDTIIATINKFKPDILLVALGAAKGTDWIHLNRNRLDAGIISHLGATVNFLAGTVQRAPRFMQTLGLEWMWRIYQEPILLTRYLEDGFILGRHMLSRLLLIFRYRQLRRTLRVTSDETIDWQEDDQRISIVLGIRPKPLPGILLGKGLEKRYKTPKDILLDFRVTNHLDGAFLSSLLTLKIRQQKAGRRLRLVRVNRKIAKIFDLFDMRDLLTNG